MVIENYSSTSVAQASRLAWFKSHWLPDQSCYVLIKRTAWTRPMALSWWQHNKHCSFYYSYYYYHQRSTKAKVINAWRYESSAVHLLGVHVFGQPLCAIAPILSSVRFTIRLLHAAGYSRTDFKMLLVGLPMLAKWEQIELDITVQ